MMGFLCALFTLATLVTCTLTFVSADWRPVAAAGAVMLVAAAALAVMTTSDASFAAGVRP